MARPAEPTISLPTWATTATVHPSGTTPTDSNDVIEPATGNRNVGWQVGAPVRQFMNHLQRAAGEWIEWCRDTLRDTPSSFTDVSAALLRTSSGDSCIIDKTGNASEWWDASWTVNQGGATDDCTCIDTDGDRFVIGYGTDVTLRERDTPSSEDWTKTMPATVVDVSVCGDEVFIANGLNLRRYARDGATFSEFTVSGTGLINQVEAGGDMLGMTRRDLGAANCKLELYAVGTLVLDATFGTKSRAGSYAALGLSPTRVVFGGAVDGASHAKIYDRAGTEIFSVELEDTSSTPTVVDIACNSARIALLHDDDDNSNQVTLLSNTGRTVWQAPLYESSPTIKSASIDDRYVYALTSATLHVLDIRDGSEVAQYDLPASGTGRAVASDGEYAFVAHEHDTNNFAAVRVGRGASLWRRHDADDRYRHIYSLLAPQRA